MWEKLAKKATMPHYVWICICFILVAIGIKILTSADVLIDLNDRTLRVVQKEREAEEKKAFVESTVEETLVKLERLEKDTPHPEAKKAFSVAQMRIKEDIKPGFGTIKPRFHTAKE